MTPRDAQIMIEAKSEHLTAMMRFRDTLNGLLCSIVAEPHRDQDKRSDPFTAADFTIIPDEPEKSTQEKPEGMTEEQLRRSVSTMRAWVAHTGGVLNG